MYFSREPECVAYSGARRTICYRQCVDSICSGIYLGGSKTTWRMELESLTDRARACSPPHRLRSTILPGHFGRVRITRARGTQFCRFVDSRFRIASGRQPSPSGSAMYITRAVPVRRTLGHVSSERTVCRSEIDAVDQRFSVTSSRATHNRLATDPFGIRNLRGVEIDFRNAAAEYAILQPIPPVANHPYEGGVPQLRPC